MSATAHCFVFGVKRKKLLRIFPKREVLEYGEFFVDCPAAKWEVLSRKFLENESQKTKDEFERITKENEANLPKEIREKFKREGDNYVIYFSLTFNQFKRLKIAQKVDKQYDHLLKELKKIEKKAEEVHRQKDTVETYLVFCTWP
ncbi:YobA family protein [Candidatus Woesearchaeota archaeon]|nr:YobA family protein [Candidatus Woesearchaeota archaeon]